jgi:hypothetical protein
MADGPSEATSVGTELGFEDPEGILLKRPVGDCDGLPDGWRLGLSEGARDGSSEGCIDGTLLGAKLGMADGPSEATSVGTELGFEDPEGILLKRPVGDWEGLSDG